MKKTNTYHKEKQPMIITLKEYYTIISNPQSLSLISRFREQDEFNREYNPPEEWTSLPTWKQTARYYAFKNVPATTFEEVENTLFHLPENYEDSCIAFSDLINELI